MSRARVDSIALIGYRATGKTTVGRLIADQLGWVFTDSDHEVESRAGQSIQRIFAEQGEQAFRELEARVLNELVSRPRQVLATGGGVVLREENRTALMRCGLIVYLSTAPEALAHRLRMDPADRPALTPLGLIDEIRTVLAAREPLYRELADLEIPTGLLGPDEVADQVVRHWRSSAAGANAT